MLQRTLRLCDACGCSALPKPRVSAQSPQLARYLEAFLEDLMSKPLPFVLLAVALTAASAPAAAADYFAGKTIEFTVGADVGGGYDIYSRTIAKYLPKYIPGNPIIVVKNLPGAGSAKTADLSDAGRAEGRNRHRRADARRGDRPAAGRQCEAAIRPDQARLSRHRRFAARASAPPSSIPRPRTSATRRSRRR